jgi:hypothetical protein
VAHAQVGFVPAEGSPAEQKPASGQTDAQGRYSLSTYVKPGRQSGGAMAGKYKVTVQKGFAQNQIVSYDDLKNRKPELPPRYASAKSTPLAAEVTAGGSNQIDFTLQDSP